MHFYTYDEWLANAYYSIDNAEIVPDNSKVFSWSSSSQPPHRLLQIRSCWKDPQFLSTAGANASVKPTMSKIDCDVGCLYEMRGGEIAADRDKRGCIQPLGNAFGANFRNYNWDHPTTHPVEYPYIGIETSSTGKEPYVINHRLQGVYKEILGIDLRAFNYINRILVFQSIYSGAISFEDANSSLELYFCDNWVGLNEETLYDLKMNTNIHSSSSLMIAALMITFEQIGDTNFLILDNICQPVYGHVDMDHKFDWNLLWETYVPSYRVLESSIMHYEKKDSRDSG